MKRLNIWILKKPNSIFFGGDNMNNLTFVIMPRVSKMDASVHLVDEHGNIVLEINAHEFDSGDRQVTVNAIEVGISVVVTAVKTTVKPTR